MPGVRCAGCDSRVAADQVQTEGSSVRPVPWRSLPQADPATDRGARRGFFAGKSGTLLQDGRYRSWSARAPGLAAGRPFFAEVRKLVHRLDDLFSTATGRGN